MSASLVETLSEPSRLEVITSKLQHFGSSQSTLFIFSGRHSLTLDCPVPPLGLGTAPVFVRRAIALTLCDVPSPSSGPGPSCCHCEVGWPLSGHRRRTGHGNVLCVTFCYCSHVLLPSFPPMDCPVGPEVGLSSPLLLLPHFLLKISTSSHC